MSNEQLACTYAALILSENPKADGAAIEAVCKAGGVTVSKQMATQFAGFLGKTNLKQVLSSAGKSGGGAAAPAAAAPAAAPAKDDAKGKKEEKKAAPVEEEDDGPLGLFD